MHCIQRNIRFCEQRKGNSLQMQTAKYLPVRDIFRVTTVFLFFLQYNFLTNFDNIHSILLEKNHHLLDPLILCFCKNSYVEQGLSSPFRFLNLVTALSMKFHCRKILEHMQQSGIRHTAKLSPFP